jgi:hypothetical protein
MNQGSHYVFPTSMKEGTKILKLHNGQEVYIPIEYLQKGDLIKTGNGYKVITAIGKIVVQNPGNHKRSKDCLYQLTKKNYPELFEDLIVSSCTSISVDKSTHARRNNTAEYLKHVGTIEDTYSLLAYHDERAIPYEKAGTYTMYQLAVQNNGNSGAYANGLFMGTANANWLQIISKMTII